MYIPEAQSVLVSALALTGTLTKREYIFPSAPVRDCSLLAAPEFPINAAYTTLFSS